jgi:FkbM family methyltransferase
MMNPVLARSEGTGARLHYLALVGYAIGTAPMPGFGAQRTARLLSRVFGAGHRVTVRMPAGFSLSIDLNDPYWTRCVFGSFHYEPELENLLRAVLRPGTCFIDCGASIGYWSIFASMRLGSSGTVVAVEASSSTFRELTTNIELNHMPIRAFHKALHAVSDARVGFYKNFDRPAAAHISDASLGECDWQIGADIGKRSVYEEVETVSLDEILCRYCEGCPSDRVVVKLDVEGAEIAALQGARGMLGQNPLIIYEDHARDPESKVTRFVKDELGYEVFAMYDERLEQLQSLDEMRTIKKFSDWGYNFAACDRNSTFLPELRQLSRH